MKNENKRRDIEILLVEANYPDVRLVQEYFKDERMINHKLYIVNTGLEAIKFLRKEGQYIDVPTPDLILLDLFLPTMDGWTVLKEIRSDSKFKDNLICLMTSTESDAEYFNLEKQNAIFFVLKPVDVEKFLNLITKAEEYLPEELRIFSPKNL